MASFSLLALRAASQSNTEWKDLALKGDRALMGESTWDTAGEGGILRLGKEFAPVGGADIGSCVKGLGGIAGAVAGALCSCSCSHLQETSVCSLVAVEGSESGVDSGVDSGVVSPEVEGLKAAGELRDMCFRKSV